MRRHPRPLPVLRALPGHRRPLIPQSLGPRAPLCPEPRAPPGHHYPSARTAHLQLLGLRSPGPRAQIPPRHPGPSHPGPCPPGLVQETQILART